MLLYVNYFVDYGYFPVLFSLASWLEEKYRSPQGSTTVIITEDKPRKHIIWNPAADQSSRPLPPNPYTTTNRTHPPGSQIPYARN